MTPEDGTTGEWRQEDAWLRMAAIAEVRHLDFDGIWASIEAVPAPGPDGTLPWEQWPTWAQRFVPWTIRWEWRTHCFMLGIVAVTVGLYFISPWLIIPGIALLLFLSVVWLNSLDSFDISRSRPLGQARRIWEERLDSFRRWGTEAAFHAARDELAAKRDELRALLTTPRDSHPKLAELRKRPHRYAWLASFPLEEAAIPELSKSSREILRRASVLTAAEADPDTVKSLLKTRPKAVRAVRQWRQELARRYDPKAAVALLPADDAAVAEEFARWQQMLIQTYKAGPQHLSETSRLIAASREKRVRKMQEVWEALQRVERRHRRQGLPEPEPEPPPRRKGTRRRA